MPAPIIPIPIYLDYPRVFDILAIIDDGLSEFQEVRTVYSDSNISDTGGKIEGVAKGKTPLGFLQMSGDGEYKRSKTSSVKTSQDVSTKKVHTSTSLFAKMRSKLIEQKLLKIEIDGSNISTGDFVEFQGKLEKLEIATVLETMIKAVNLGNTLSGNNNQKKTVIPKEVKLIQETIGVFSDNNLIYHPSPELSIIVQLDPTLLSDINADALLRGRYRIFGKVVRIEKDGYNFLEETDLGIFKTDKLQEMLGDSLQNAVNADGVSGLLNIPESVPFEIQGKTLIIKATAIYI